MSFFGLSKTIMNDIESTRSEIEKYFNANNLINGSKSGSFSLSEKYKLETEEYLQTKSDVNWVVTLAKVLDRSLEKPLFEFFADNDHFFYKWLNKEGKEYLVCAETLCGGQTVIDVSNGMMKSYSSREDGFIWADFYMSPSGSKLAIIGCFWACPYEIRIYDFENPLALPLPEIEAIPLLDIDKDSIEWIDEKSFSVEGYDGTARQHVIGLNNKL